MIFKAKDDTYFWATGNAWGSCEKQGKKGERNVIYGKVRVDELIINPD
jgi:hypothetical protein